MPAIFELVVMQLCYILDRLRLIICISFSIIGNIRAKLVTLPVMSHKRVYNHLTRENEQEKKELRGVIGGN